MILFNISLNTSTPKYLYKGTASSVTYPNGEFVSKQLKGIPEWLVLMTTRW